jgi:integrase
VAKPAKLSSAPPSPAKALTDTEIQQLLKAAEPTRWHSFVVLALATGARRGELCGLSWPDIDFDAGVIRIRHSFSQTKGCLELKDTKTHRGRRLHTSSPTETMSGRSRASWATRARTSP